MSQINIKILAATLGVSTSTVSRAFKGNSDINPATKERILKLAGELGYSPNIYASNLRESRSKTIAIIIPEFGNNFFTQAIKGIEQQARANGYHTLIYITEDDSRLEAQYVRDLCNGRVEGVIMSASGEDSRHDHLDLLRSHGIPLVFFDRYYEDVFAPVVTANDYESSYQATQHLIQRGCRKPAYLVVKKSISIGKIRMQGYLDALRDAGIQGHDSWIMECSNDKRQIYDTLKQRMDEVRPDGAFASVERLALPFMRICRERRLRIPEDVKLICFSCMEYADMLNPALSTVQQPAREMGKEAASLLFERLAAGEEAKSVAQIILPSKLIFEQSTSFQSSV